MKIAILTSGIRAVPAVQGGAVENLVDFYLEYNDRHRLHDITVYSVWHPDVKGHPALMSEVNHYKYIMVDSLVSKIRKAVYKKRHHNEYYHYTIEYFLEQALKHIRKEHYDGIIVENRPGFVLKLKKRTNSKLILHLHNDFLNLNTREAKYIFDGFDGIVSVSEYITRRIQEISPDAIKCKTVHNAIDWQQFHTATATQRGTLGLSEKDFVIVYSGRLTKEKGIMQLIQTIKQIHDIDNLKLLIIGASSYGKDMRPTSFINQLEKESAPIHEKVVFTGFIDYKRMPSCLKSANMAIIPSMWEEPFGLTVVEAMAAGLPLITTRSGGIPEICEGVATIVDRANIVNQLAKAILDLYQHPEKRKQMAAASLERSKLFDKVAYARHFFEAICL